MINFELFKYFEFYLNCIQIILPQFGSLLPRVRSLVIFWIFSFGRDVSSIFTHVCFENCCLSLFFKKIKNNSRFKFIFKLYIISEDITDVIYAKKLILKISKKNFKN